MFEKIKKYIKNQMHERNISKKDLKLFIIFIRKDRL